MDDLSCPRQRASARPVPTTTVSMRDKRHRWNFAPLVRFTRTLHFCSFISGSLPGLTRSNAPRYKLSDEEPLKPVHAHRHCLKKRRIQALFCSNVSFLNDVVFAMLLVR